MVENNSTAALKKKLKTLEQVYFITTDEDTRRGMLLVIDDIKIELKKRGEYD